MDIFEAMYSVESTADMVLHSMLWHNATAYSQHEEPVDFPELYGDEQRVHHVLGMSSGAYSAIRDDMSRKNYFRSAPDMLNNVALEPVERLRLEESTMGLLHSSENIMHSMIDSFIDDCGHIKACQEIRLYDIMEAVVVLGDDYEYPSRKVSLYLGAMFIMLWIASKQYLDGAIWNLSTAIQRNHRWVAHEMLDEHRRLIRTHILLAFHCAVDEVLENAPWEWVEPMVLSACIENLGKKQLWVQAAKIVDIRDYEHLQNEEVEYQ